MKQFTFTYPQFDDPILVQLREQAPIEITESMNELDAVKAITGYAHTLFTHDGENEPSSHDPLTILKEATEGQSFRCVEYSTLASALLWAYAIPARTVGLKTSDVETRKSGAGHVVIEFWSFDLQKWIMCDVQKGIIPEFEGELLSAYDLSKHLGATFQLVHGSRFTEGTVFKNSVIYNEWIREYLFFYDTPAEMTLLPIHDRTKQLIVMLVPEETEPPVMFQRSFAMNAEYTHDVAEFYQPFEL